MPGAAPLRMLSCLVEGAMPGDESNLKELTRALWLGVSLGTLPVGMGVSAQVQTAQADMGAESAASGGLSESQACDIALASGARSALERLLTRFPKSACIPSVLLSTSPRILAQIAPKTLAGLPASTIRRIPQQVRRHLRFQDEQPASTRKPASTQRPGERREPQSRAGY